MPNLVEDIKLLIRTRRPLVTIQTVEEQYAARLIRLSGREMGLPVLEWSISDGLWRTQPPGAEVVPASDSLDETLRHLRVAEQAAVYVLKDALRFLNNPTTERLLRDVATDFAHDGGRTVFMIDATGKLPESLATVAVPYDLALPEAKEIYDIVRQTYRELSARGDGRVQMTRQELDRYLEHLRGLTRLEISQVVAEALLSHGSLCSQDLPRVLEAKRRRLRQTGVLDYIPPPETPPKVGGMAGLRRWLELRSKAFGPEARKFGLEPPKGILMLGVQGCGKSLMARFVAASWQMPLLRLDVGALYDKYVGETERHLRQAFSVASAMAPCVLWIDEVEKAFASATVGAGSAATDGGLSQRLFGQLLTWMQDRPAPVFIVATANDVTALPPELLRKGRFDEIFFVDLPSAQARREILGIHLSKRQRDPAKFDLQALAAAGEGFSGSEIEQAVVSALYGAFSQGRDLTTQDILDEMKSTKPLSVVMAEKVRDLRAWAKGRCVMAD
jgi:hypothetical protein